jgi:hypothetical protein
MEMVSHMSWTLGVLGLLVTPQIDQRKTPEQQIEEAVSALPPSMQDDAAVMGYDEAGALVELRAGTNGITCRADDPTVRAWIVVCYPPSLATFVDRSLAMRKEGKDTPARVRTLNEEIQSGKISMPPQAVLYSRQGNSSEISDGVVIFHIPNATRETTGLPTLPTPGFPWLAEAGTPMANIRISTP